MSQSAVDQRPSAAPPKRPGAVVFGSLLLVMSLAALDQTIISTALRSVVSDLGGVASLSWVVTAYLLTSTATTPLWGMLGDVRGKKPMLILAVIVFLTGSCWSGAATSMGMLIAARALQGAGAGGLMALASAGVASLVDMRLRGTYMGYVQSMFAVASVVGPLAGGAIVDQVSWRWVFYVNLPIGLLGLLGLLVAFPSEDTRREHRIDYLGAALLAGTVVLLELIALWGGTQYGWSSPQMLALIAGFVVALGLLVWRQRAAAEPILPPALVGNSTVRWVSLALFIATSSLFATTTFMPIYLQVVRGQSPTISGLMLIPMMLGITGTTAVVGKIMAATGKYKMFPVLGMLITSAALLWFSRLGATSSWGLVLGGLLAAGIGFGMVTQVLVVAIQNTVDQKMLGSATATANLFRSLGGAVGVAVLGSVLNRALTHDPAGRQAEAAVQDPSSATSGGPAVTALLHALTDVFLVAAGAALVAALVCTLIREAPMRQWGGGGRGGRGGAQQGQRPDGARQGQGPDAARPDAERREGSPVGRQSQEPTSGRPKETVSHGAGR